MKKLLFIAIMLLVTGTSFAQHSKTKNEKTSISISNSDHNYDLRANFDADKYEKVKSTIIKAIGKASESKTEESIWKLNDVYQITLKEEKLTITLDKDKATGNIYKTISKLGQEIQRSLNQPATPDTAN